jgi:hypothetical protein
VKRRSSPASRFARRVIALLPSVALCPVALLAQASDPRDVVRRVAPSVVLVTVLDAGGQPIALGSGFAVSDSTFVTNRHVVAGGARATVKGVGDSAVRTAIGIVAVDSVHDLVLLQVRGLRPVPLRIAPSRTVEVGQRVIAIGNPRGLEGTVSEGIVSGIRSAGRDTLLQITAPISPGSSGGPVVDDRGEVIGVAVGAIVDGQNLNFAVPSDYVARLVASSGALRSLSSIRAQRAALPGVGRGSSTTRDGVTLASFLWDRDASYDVGVECYPLCAFSFSIRNNLETPVRRVRYLIAFYDRTGEPIEAVEGETTSRLIQPRLASRERHGVETSVRRLMVRVVFRVLDFEIVE